MNSTYSFENGEIVFCFHGPMMYEAKITKREMTVGPAYFVHYKGWKASYDEWVPEERMLKFNDSNRDRKVDLEAQYVAKKRTVKVDLDKTKKRRRDSIMQEEEFMRRPEIKIALPESLKTLLVDDWEHVTKDHQLVSLPKTLTVSDILRDFGSSTDGSDSVQEVTRGLEKYFEKAIGSILLYKFERLQYASLKATHDLPMSQIYGSEHLLRLFVQLPSLIAHTNMDEDAVKILKDHLADFLGYLDQNHGSLFGNVNYETASSDYITAYKSQ